MTGPIDAPTPAGQRSDPHRPPVKALPPSLLRWILIPAILREFAGIQSTVRVIGVWESIEIWAPEQLETDYDRIMPGLAAELDSLDDRRA